MSHLNTTYFLSGSTTRNWYSSKIPLETKNSSQLQLVLLNFQEEYRVENKLAFQGQIYKFTI